MKLPECFRRHVLLVPEAIFLDSGNLQQRKFFKIGTSMKRFTVLLAGAMGLGLMVLSACETNSPGEKNTLGSYTVMIDGRPDKVTKAATASVNDMKLTDVISTGTTIDGKVMAKDAQKDDVEIDIEQAGENVSKVTVRVGTGDEAVSHEILDRIKKNL
jgi:hypothetical protein